MPQQQAIIKILATQEAFNLIKFQLTVLTNWKFEAPKEVPVEKADIL